MASHLKIRHFTFEAAMILLSSVQKLLPFNVWQNNRFFTRQPVGNSKKFGALEVRLLLVLFLRHIFRSLFQFCHKKNLGLKLDPDRVRDPDSDGMDPDSDPVKLNPKHLGTPSDGFLFKLYLNRTLEFAGNRKHYGEKSKLKS